MEPGFWPPEPDVHRATVEGSLREVSQVEHHLLQRESSLGRTQPRLDRIEKSIIEIRLKTPLWLFTRGCFPFFRHF